MLFIHKRVVQQVLGCHLSRATDVLTACLQLVVHVISQSAVICAEVEGIDQFFSVQLVIGVFPLVTWMFSSPLVSIPDLDQYLASLSYMFAIPCHFNRLNGN